jgi:hypothetical protein
MRAAWCTCIGWRTDATSTSVPKPVIADPEDPRISRMPSVEMLVEAADERRDVRGAGLGREQRLGRAEAQGDVGADALVLAGLDRLEPSGMSDLDHDVLAQRRQLAGFFIISSGQADHLGRHRPFTTSQISSRTSRNFLPVLATSDGLVVTPSTSPMDAASLIRECRRCRMKNCMTAPMLGS